MSETVQSPPAPLAREKVLFLATGLAGSLLMGTTAQFPASNLVDIQGGLGSSADEAAWILTVYTMASLVGVTTSVTLLRTLGVRRYLIVLFTGFSVAAFCLALTSDLGGAIVLRAVQGFFAGGVGPAAFAAVFIVTGGPRLAGGVTLLAFALVFPTTAGPMIAGFIGDALGWRAIFIAQAATGLGLAMAAVAWAPRQNLDTSALKTDWFAIALLSTALAALTLVISEGARRFWLESDLIFWSLATGVSALAGFAFVARFSPLKIINPALLLTRAFGLPIGLNLLFRASLVVVSFLVPQFLLRTQGYRPLEISELMLWATVPQVVALPLVWWLMQRLETRAIIVLGVLTCAVAASLMMNETGAAAGAEFKVGLAMFALGEILFLTPAMVHGTATLKPADLATASLSFNISTAFGTAGGVGLMSHLVTEREKFHSNVVTESVSLYHVLDADRLASVANAIGNRVTDDTLATARAAILLGAQARRESWVLAFNDAFLVIAVVLALTALSVVALVKSAPLRK